MFFLAKFFLLLQRLLNLFASFGGFLGLAGSFAGITLHMDGFLTPLVTKPSDFHCVPPLYIFVLYSTLLLYITTNIPTLYIPYVHFSLP